MTEYRRKPEIVEIIHVHGDTTTTELLRFTRAFEVTIDYAPGESKCSIISEQGEMVFALGDYVAKDENGKLQVYSPIEFKNSFELVYRPENIAAFVAELNSHQTVRLVTNGEE